MSYVGRVIKDGDTESLIRMFLKAGAWSRAYMKELRSAFHRVNYA